MFPSAASMSADGRLQVFVANSHAQDMLLRQSVLKDCSLVQLADVEVESQVQLPLSSAAETPDVQLMVFRTDVKAYQNMQDQEFVGGRGQVSEKSPDSSRRKCAYRQRVCSVAPSAASFWLTMASQLLLWLETPVAIAMR